MEVRYTRLIQSILPITLLALTFAVPAFAQNSSPSASESMHDAGQQMKAAGSNVANAAKSAGEGTETAVKDTTITAKVKKDLHGDANTKGQKIHVSTVAGIVTLKGKVASEDVSKRAAEIAQGVDGVKSVNNELAVSSTM